MRIGARAARDPNPTERPGWPNASLPPSALLRVRAGPPLLRPLERLLVLLLHLVSGCSHGCSMLLLTLTRLGLGLRACSVVDSSKPNETVRLELTTKVGLGIGRFRVRIGLEFGQAPRAP